MWPHWSPAMLSPPLLPPWPTCPQTTPTLWSSSPWAHSSPRSSRWRHPPRGTTISGSPLLSWSSASSCAAMLLVHSASCLLSSVLAWYVHGSSSSSSSSVNVSYSISSNKGPFTIRNGFCTKDTEKGLSMVLQQQTQCADHSLLEYLTQ